MTIKTTLNGRDWTPYCGPPPPPPIFHEHLYNLPKMPRSPGNEMYIMKASALSLFNQSLFCSESLRCGTLDMNKHKLQQGFLCWPNREKNADIFSVAGTVVTLNEDLGAREIWWRQQMETFSALLAICAGNSPFTDELPTQRPVTRSFDVFFDLGLNERLSKQSWFETPSHPLWRHSNMHLMREWITPHLWAM